ncbi:WD40 repeat domain-containing protein [Streptomyces olivaceus]|uniref:WD40 repeat domain-containing protein n=1 Tax=Streptomyces olivaceus TaxID=47716 RepID=UPI0036382A13
MLIALAFSEGKGLPRGRTWTVMSTVISGVPCTEGDVSWVLDVAEAYIAEVVDDDRRSVYRLYHKALAEHLRATADRPPEELQRLVVEALISLVPVASGEQPDWFAAVPYVRQHLSTHAAAAGVLATLIKDPGFLLASEPLALLRALASIEGESSRRIRSSYEQVAHRLTSDHAIGGRAADLQLSARRCEASELADRIEEVGVDLPWSARWAWWSTSGVHRLLQGHTKTVGCVAVGELDGRPIAVTGSDDETVRVWDLTSQRQIGEPLPVGTSVSAVSIGELGDYTVVLTGAADGTVKVWDLSAGQEYGEALTGHTNRVESITIGTFNGRTVVLTASADGTARIWDLIERQQLGAELAAHKRTVRDADLGQFGGRPVAITGGDDKAVHIWDLTDVFDGGDARLDGSPLIGPADAVTAVCMAELDGRSVALVGDAAGMLSRWDLTDRRQIGEPVMAHVYWRGSGVRSAVTGRLKGRLVALTCGRGEARLWDLRALQQVAPPLRGHVEDIQAATLTGGDSSLGVTVGRDRTARIWDLTAEQPDEGHSQPVGCTALCEDRGRTLLVTGGQDATARLWDLRTRVQIGQPMKCHSGVISAVAIAVLDGQTVVATGGSDTEVRLWDPFTGSPLKPPFLGHTNAVRCAVFCALGGVPVLVTGGEDGTVRVWDVARGEMAGPPLVGHIGGVEHLAVRPSGRGIEIILATSLDHAYVWQIGHGPGNHWPSEPRAHFDAAELTPSARTVGVAFHGGRAVAVVTFKGNEVYVHDVLNASRVGGPYPGHTGLAIAGTLGRIGEATVVVTASLDNTVRIWDLETAAPMGPPLEGYNLPWDDLRCAAPVLTHIDGVDLAVVATWRDVRVWDVASMRPIGEPLGDSERGLVSADILRPPGGKAVVVTGATDGVVRTHDLDSGQQVAAHLTSTGQVTFGAVAAQMDGDILLVRSSWPDTQAWSLSSRKQLGKRATLSRRSCLLTTNSGEVAVVSIGPDYTLDAWGLHSLAPICPPMSGHTAEVMALRAGTVGRIRAVASASADGTVRLWDPSRGDQLGEPLGGHDEGAYAVEIAHWSGRSSVITGTGDGRLRVWDMASGQDTSVDLEPFPSAVRAIRAAEIDGVPLLLAADRYGLMRVWAVDAPLRTAELDIGSGINGIAIDTGGQVCVATDMGVIALRLNLAAHWSSS